MLKYHWYKERNATVIWSESKLKKSVKGRQLMSKDEDSTFSKSA